LAAFDRSTDVHDGPSEVVGINAKAMVAVTKGDTTGARELLRFASEGGGVQPDALVVRSLLNAICAQLLHEANAPELVTRTIDLVRHQGAKRWEPRVRILEGAVSGDAQELLAAIQGAFGPPALAILELADVIGASLHVFAHVPEEIEASIVMWPNRWLPVLRRQLEGDTTPSARPAAALIARFGERDDVHRLAGWERRSVTQPKRRVMTQELVRRVAPTLRIHDLGRTAISIGHRELRLSQTRRKVASLILYLVTRPNQIATREQAIDDLWPEQDPSGGLNSLHQTVYFLRRDIDPDGDDALRVNYLVMESETISLDLRLVHIDSVSFYRQATSTLANAAVAEHGAQLASEYSGRFAPEFEYDEWTTAWRDRVHTSYLQLVQAAADGMFRSGQARRAAEVLSRALVIDPAAIELEPPLVRALWVDGAKAAAKEQYEHYASAYRQDLGLDPEPLNVIVEAE
jgi:DNA-binding SARP family transcriptional activator